MTRIPLHRDPQPMTAVSGCERGVRVKRTKTYQTHGTGVAVAVDPVRAVICVKVLAPVLVETAAARHGEKWQILLLLAVLELELGGIGV